MSELTILMPDGAKVEVTEGTRHAMWRKEWNMGSHTRGLHQPLMLSDDFVKANGLEEYCGPVVPEKPWRATEQESQ